MATPREPYPYFSRIPAGPVKESLRLLWNQVNALTGGEAGAGPTIADLLFAQLGLTADQSIADSTDTIITWETVIVPSGVVTPVASITAAPTRLLIPRDTPKNSVWWVTAAIRWQANAAGIRRLQLIYTDSGAVAILAAVSQDATSANETYQELNFLLIDPAQAATVTLQVFQTSGGPLNVETDISRFGLVRLL